MILAVNSGTLRRAWGLARSLLCSWGNPEPAMSITVLPSITIPPEELGPILPQG